MPFSVAYEGPKRKAVAHCVHILRNVKIGNIRKWLKIQKTIGIAKVRMYDIGIGNEQKLIEEIRLNYTGFVDIVDYKTNFSSNF